MARGLLLSLRVACRPEGVVQPQAQWQPRELQVQLVAVACQRQHPRLTRHLQREAPPWRHQTCLLL